MRLTVNLFVTQDGVYQSPGAREEDPRDGFEFGGWLPPHVDDDFNRIVGGWFEHTEAMLLGRYTYDVMAAHWPNVTDPDDEGAALLNTVPKYLVSSTTSGADWANTTVISTDPIDRIRDLKSRPGGELQVHGSGALARSLHDAGLVDEFRLLVFPVVVGAGKRLFGEGAAPSAFELAHTEATGSGVVYQVLRPIPFRAGGIVIEDGREVLTD